MMLGRVHVMAGAGVVHDRVETATKTNNDKYYDEIIAVRRNRFRNQFVIMTPVHR